jgi:hypothetical protein
MLLPIFGNTTYNPTKGLKEEEKKEFDNLRVHNITLASFTIVIVTLILAFPDQTRILQNVDSLMYFSISLVCFFNASYFALFRMHPVYWYIGDTIEMTGILSLGIGFLIFISKLANTFGLDKVYGIFLVYNVFLISLIALATVGVFLYKDFFFPKRT